MASVLLLTTADRAGASPWAASDFRRLQAAAAVDRYGVHTRTDDPRQADVILFVGTSRPDCRDVRTHPWVRRYREKCFHFEAGDSPVAFLPGVYASAERPWHCGRAAGGFYLRVFENDAIDAMPAASPRRWLFSFVGTARNARVRSRLMRLRHARGLLVDTSEENQPQTDAAEGVNAVRWRRYIESLMDSSFVLCPRGLGPSSWRLFEVMKAGRAPVILSNRWIRPSGPEWNTFSITIAESDAARIPAILEARESDAAAMGMLARAAWEGWFSKEVAFHRIVEACLTLQSDRVVPERIARFRAYAELMRPANVRHLLLSPLKQRFLSLRE